MSDLLSLLSLGSAGIGAQNTGVAIATNNVANANTKGFSRQRIDLESLLAAPLVGGVRSGAPQRVQDHLLAGRIRASSGSLARATSQASAVLDVEARLTTGPAVHDQLGELFQRLGRLSASPTDPTSRTAVLASTRALAAGIQARAGELEAARADANVRITDNAAEATSIAARLADANTAIARANDPVMRDERDRLATRLSELVGGAARIDGDGQMRFVLDGGAVLVDGERAAQLATSRDPVTHDVRLEVVDGAIRRDVTAAIAAGTIGGDLTARDGTIARAAAELDQLAFDITSSFNAIHTANAGLDGVSGRPMFVPLAQVAGAARAIAIDPALAADPSRLAAATPGAGPGDNRGALAMFALASAPAASGGRTLTGAALDIVTAVASQAAEATATAKRDELVADHLAGLRDSLAGVDIEEELTNLARFEHASSAMTRFVSTIDGLLGDLIDRL